MVVGGAYFNIKQMKNFLVQIIWNDPYPKRYEYRSEGSNFAVGIARAVRTFRKENKGRRVKHLDLKVQEYGSHQAV